ncbi:Nn.00g112470.m01.CDS01 [Neocucurbitaria sp. VM-36]
MPHIESKRWLVQKYGGTSIGKLLPTITGSIIPSFLQSHRVAVVCSARSGTTKSNGTTSLLLDAIAMATSNDVRLEDLESIINSIKKDHLTAAKAAIGEDSSAILHAVELQIKKDCEGLHGLLKATVMIGEISDRITDRVLAFGETLSCRIVAASLESKGIASKVVLLQDIVEETYGEDPRHLVEHFKNHPAAFLRGLTEAIARRIESCGGAVPIITGFFGAMPGSLIKCVSRGYSDLCAALCAVTLSSEELQIWKEVDGIYTADPRKIKAARLLATITSEEAAELTYYGSEVIHPLTIEQIDGASIPVRLKNVMHPSGDGTIIHASQKTPPSPMLEEPSTEALEPKDEARVAVSYTTFMTANGYYGPSQHRRRPTAVTTKESITVLNVRSYGTSSLQRFLSCVSTCLEAHGLAIDLISSSQHMLSLAICAPEPHTLDDAVEKLEKVGDISLLQKMSIVSVIGHRMRNMVGIGAEIFSALANAKVNIYLISQGAGEINISFVINAQDAQLATEVIHEHVLKIPLHKEQENAFVKGPWLY